jgi:general secretion pathway protein G
MAFLIKTGDGAPASWQRGFTLLELLVVMAIIGTLLSLAVPHYFHSVEKTREAVLREDLKILRITLDRYYADAGAYPESLRYLVEQRYLRSIPEDPMTGSDQTWIVVPAADRAKGAVADIRSGATGRGLDGSLYREW